MKTRRQWIAVGSDKVPVRRINPHDPANWLSYDEAKAVGPLVGFVFTPTDPFFFIDIDKCLVDGQWSPLAVELCETFKGAAVEISMSGRGIHIFGSYTAPPAHSCKNAENGLELYTFGRFAIVTETCTAGNAATVLDGPLNALISKYFNPSKKGGSITWTDGPDPEWNGPEDDDELLAIMLGSRSARASMGYAASIIDLWTRNEEKLGEIYPDNFGGRPFDWSSADAALCNHLAFWTGRDCARMERMFGMSALVRDKWTERPDYRERTIQGAAGSCKAVYQQRRQPAPAAPGPPGTAAPVSGLQLLTPHEQREYFSGMVYVRDLNAIFTRDGALIGRPRFDAMYGGYDFSLDNVNSKSTKYPWEAFTLSQAVRFPKVISAVFRPELPPGEIIEKNGMLAVNTYVPIKIDMVEGDVSPFLNHIANILPNEIDQRILLSYMAACVQYPGVKFQWAPLIQGAEGNGKTFLAYSMINSIGQKYCHCPNATDIANKFNSWLSNKLFIIIEDIPASVDENRVASLKNLITQKLIEIQGKGQDQYTGDNRANFMFLTNPKDAISKSSTDRRFAIFYTAQQTRQDVEKLGPTYFPNLYKWADNDKGYEKIAYFLKHYPIDPEYNPAGKRTRAPDTSSTGEALKLSMTPLERETQEAIDEDRDGFKNGWISSIRFNQLLGHRVLSPSKRVALFNNLGYRHHPLLKDGRANQMVPSEGGKPVLYVHMTRQNNENTPEEARQAYMKAQEYKPL